MAASLLITTVHGVFLSVLVYDITKRSSFLSLQRWIEEVRRYTASNVILVLVGKLHISRHLCEITSCLQLQFLLDDKVGCEM